MWDHASIWYGVTIRGDINLVRIGSFANVQDNTVIEEATAPLAADHDGSVVIGHYVTVCFPLSYSFSPTSFQNVYNELII